MIIHSYIPKSKKRKVPKLVKLRQEEWQKQILAISPKTNYTNTNAISRCVPTPKIPAGRETPLYASLNTGFIPCIKKSQNSYTGDKMKGIGTMHKSNAVPIFTDNEAKEISSMRR
jgi:hypothetical protein